MAWLSPRLTPLELPDLLPNLGPVLSIRLSSLRRPLNPPQTFEAPIFGQETKDSPGKRCPHDLTAKSNFCLISTFCVTLRQAWGRRDFFGLRGRWVFRRLTLAEIVVARCSKLWAPERSECVVCGV